MPIYTVESGKKYLVRIHVRGKPKTKTIYGTRREAEKFEAKWRLELEELGESEYRNAPQFSTFCLSEYAKHAKTHLKASTWRNRRYQIATLVEHFGKKRLDKITAADVAKFQAHRVEKDGVRPSKVNDDTKVLRAILNWAREQGVPAKVPRFRPLPERGTKKRVIAWTPEQCETLLAAMQEKAPHLVAITVTLLNTGMRKGEALQLRWRDVDLTAGVIYVRPSEEWQPKNNKPREIPVGPTLDAVLRAHKAVVKGPHCFPSKAGRPYARWPQRDWDEARKHSKVPGSPHTCRHTFASLFLQGCPDLFLLAQILGHSHGRVTELYSHLMPDHLERARGVVSIGLPAVKAKGGDDGR